MPDDNLSQPDQVPDKGPFAALYIRDFRLFWVGFLISNVGTWMQITATSWLLYELTDSPFQLGLNGLFRAVPPLCLGLFTGTLTDRYDRKKILLVTQVTLMLLALSLGLLDWTGTIRPWHIYGLTLISATVSSLDGPARHAIFPSLVPRNILPNAIALNSLLWKGTALIGPLFAGIAITLVGTYGTFFINAASFLAVVAALYSIHAPVSKSETNKRHFFQDFKEGISYTLSRRTILGIMIMESVASVFGLDQAMLTIFARDVLQVGASGLGYLHSARGLGAVLGSGLLIYLRQPSHQGRILFQSAILYGISFALFGLSYSFALSLFLLVLTGATDIVWSATRNTILQLEAHEGIRGRVMGVFTLSNRGLHPLGQTETGLVVPLIGPRGTTFLGGTLVALTTLVTILKIPSIARYRWK